LAKFDRYILSQLTMLFGFFSLVLVLIYWINRAVVLFDQLIANGQSASVFFEFTALSLPNVIRLALPVAAFAASVYVANRLTAESELVVIQASGFSPFRMVRPVLAFGILVAVLLSALTHFLVPLSISKLLDRQAEISENITARLLTEGQFLHPADGVTFYIREITPEGQLKDIFLSDSRDPEATVTYTAREALLLRRDTGPKLVMLDGMAQILAADGIRLSTTSFTDVAYDISGFVGALQTDTLDPDTVGTLDLLRASPALIAETGFTRAELLFEAHNRFSQALTAIVTALVGFAMLLIGNFSRFGRTKQILAALAALAVLKTLENAFTDMALQDAALWPMTYAGSVLGIAVAWAILWLAARPALFRRRRGAAA